MFPAPKARVGWTRAIVTTTTAHNQNVAVGIEFAMITDMGNKIMESKWRFASSIS